MAKPNLIIKRVKGIEIYGLSEEDMDDYVIGLATDIALQLDYMKRHSGDMTLSELCSYIDSMNDMVDEMVVFCACSSEACEEWQNEMYKKFNDELLNSRVCLA